MKKSIPRSEGKTKQKSVRRSKKTAGQVLTYSSKEFHWLNKKLDQERITIELGKPFLKIQIKNKYKPENQCQNAACEQKPIARNGNLAQTKKLDLEWTVNALGKPFRKKSD